ncbi:MAG TPA: M2 family metallopeptidase, partial [Thermoplasmata archaeon]|nr:M2 family metallopeptidase [Thermoplasmata archaeon]
MSPEPADPLEFLRGAEAELLELSIDAQRAEWVQATYITPDTQALASRLNARLIQRTVELAKRSVAFDGRPLSEEARRKIHLLRTSLPLPAPSEPGASEELSAIVNG